MAKMQPFWWFLPPPCPSGECIINGGVETGDFTGWTYSAASISSMYPHSGTYCVTLDTWGAFIQQTDINVEVRCVKTFGFWIKVPADTYVRIYIEMTDGTLIDQFPAVSNGYRYIDLKAYLTSYPDKTIKRLKLESNGYIQLRIDDITLIGTG